MGKKRIIKKSKETLLEEKDTLESKMKKSVNVPVSSRTKEGMIYISSSYNNTMLTLTDMKGDVLTWASAGSIGFKGTKKATPFAASKVAESITLATKKIGIEKVAILAKGIGSGRDSAIRSLASHGLSISSITDLTSIPHNGCRPPKARRV